MFNHSDNPGLAGNSASVYLTPHVIIPVALIAGLLWFISTFFWTPDPLRNSNPTIIQKDPIETPGTYKTFTAHSSGGADLLVFITPKATYDVTARVLAIKEFHFDILGAESEVRPIHMYMGWRDMSDLAVLKYARFSYKSGFSSGRFVIKWADFGDLPENIEQAFDEHKNRMSYGVIPASTEILAQLEKISAGDIVRLEGYRVDFKVRITDTCTVDSQEVPYYYDLYVTKVTKY